MQLSRSDKLALGSGLASLASLWLVARKLRPKPPVPELVPNGDLYPSGLPDVYLWSRAVLPRIRMIFDRSFLSPEAVETTPTTTIYEGPDGDRYATVVAKDRPVFSASQHISAVLDDGGDVTIWTTPDLSRVRTSKTALAKPGWVLLAHATDRGEF